jgi:hypothetical protein
MAVETMNKGGKGVADRYEQRREHRKQSASLDLSQGEEGAGGRSGKKAKGKKGSKNKRGSRGKKLDTGEGAEMGGEGVAASSPKKAQMSPSANGVSSSFLMPSLSLPPLSSPLSATTAIAAGSIFATGGEAATQNQRREKVTSTPYEHFAALGTRSRT